MQLTESQKKKLRGLGHKLKPVVTVGSGGLTDAVLEEFMRSIDHHELMKAKVSVGDRNERDLIFERLSNASDAQLLQRVGNVGLFLKLRGKDSRLRSQI